MTEQERYRRDFDEVAASGMRKLEVSDIMNNVRNNRAGKRIGAVLLAAALLIVGTAGAYAADLGGFRKAVRYWLRGEQIEATISGSEGTYRIEDADGTLLQSGGGVAFDGDGNERPLTEEELLEIMAHPIVETDDGRTMLYYMEQSVDITDRFKEGVCRIELSDRNGMTLYVTVNADGSLAASNTGYVDP